MKKIQKILLAKPATLCVETIIKLFDRVKIDVYAVEADGFILLEHLHNEIYDAVLTDVFISGMDAVELKRRYELSGFSDVKFFGILPEINPHIEATLIRNDFDHYFVKPKDEEVIFNSIFEISSCFRTDNIRLLRDELLVTKYLQELSFSPDYQGYSCLKKAILIYVRGGTSQISITKEIYPEIAKEVKLSAPCIEKIVRNAIESAWNNASLKNQMYYFGYDRTTRKRPSNMKMVATLANHMWLELRGERLG